ncbi:MAG: type II toxin-antitoxin system RelE/ParE family toxin [Calditrichaeota bacterium]|nr:type II toxin-antitoxin system RelE/ParE family toxin [Calditrichota bacterium]
MGKIVYDPLAKDELDEAVRFYENCQKGLGRRFLSAVESSTKSISDFPDIYPIIRDHFRRCLIQKFPYGIIFSIEDELIYIIAVMHLKRKPGYWFDRIEE